MVDEWLSRWRRHPAALVVGFALITVALAALPFVLTQQFGTTWVRITNFAILYIFLALGLNIVVGFAGLLDLGYIAFYAVGAYVYALLASPQFGVHWPFWAILPLGAAVAGVFGILLGAPTLKLRGDYLAIVTLGFGEIVRIFLNNLDHPINITNGPRGHRADRPGPRRRDRLRAERRRPRSRLHRADQVLLPAPRDGDRGDLRQRAAAELAHRPRLGGDPRGRDRGARDGHQHPRHEAARVRDGRVASAASRAGMFSAIQTFVSPESFVLVESVMVLAMVVLGGMGNIWGVILGALLLSFVPEILRFTVQPLQEQLFGRMLVEPEVIRMLVFGFALVLVMILRPGGLWPSAVRRRELAARAEGSQ